MQIECMISFDLWLNLGHRLGQKVRTHSDGNQWGDWDKAGHSELQSPRTQGEDFPGFPEEPWEEGVTTETATMDLVCSVGCWDLKGRIVRPHSLGKRGGHYCGQ